ncbi:hypothetical protein, partial [Stutzerimonas stutzeri]
GNKISNPPWVKFQSAGWVNFPSAPTVQTFLKEDYRTVKVEKNGKVSVVVYAGSDMLFQINLGDGSYTVSLSIGVTIDFGTTISHLKAYLLDRQMLREELAPCAEKYSVTA